MNRAVTSLVGLIQCLLATHLAAQVALTGIRVDGIDLPVPPLPVTATDRQEALRVPAGAKEVRFTVDASALNLNQPFRLRSKLEGFDQNWRECYSHMRFVIRVLDAKNAIIAATDFPVAQYSPGWRGSLPASEFTPGRTAGLRRAWLTCDALLKESRRLPVSLRGLMA
jgi:hypothetical protein